MQLVLVIWNYAVRIRRRMSSFDPSASFRNPFHPACNTLPDPDHPSRTDPRADTRPELAAAVAVAVVAVVAAAVGGTSDPGMVIERKTRASENHGMGDNVRVEWTYGTERRRAVGRMLA